MSEESAIIFYCKGCREMVDPIRSNRGYTLTCPECKKTDVSYGTKSSIKDFYGLKKI